MGQGQSTREAGEGVLSYHPSAIGFSLPSSTSREMKLLQPSYTENAQKRSKFGPIRNRVKSRKPQVILLPIDLAEEQQQQQEPEQNEVVEVEALGSSPVPAIELPIEDTSTYPLTPPPVSPNPSSYRGDYRISAIPTHPSIIELPEPDSVAITPMEEHRDPPSDLQSNTSPRSVSPPMVHLERGILSVEPPTTTSSLHIADIASNVSRRVEDNQHHTSISDWDSRGDANMPSLLIRPRERRRSWHSGVLDDKSESLIDRTASPYRTVVGRWTSQWEDHRDLATSNHDSNEEEPTSTTSDMSLQLDEDNDVLYSRIKRKPVPLVDDWDELDYSSSSAQTTPIEVGKQQRVLWPAPEEEPISKHTSYVSRASNTTEALHSHVEQLRAGPSYQIDPSASEFLLPSNSVAFPMGDTPASPIGKRTRRLSLIGKIKERVRKTSGAMLLSSSSTSNTDLVTSTFPQSPYSSISRPLDDDQRQRISSDKAQQNLFATQSTNLYSLGRRRSNKRAKMAAMEEELFAKIASEVSRHSFASQTSRRSLRSINSARSGRSGRSGRSARNGRGRRSLAPSPLHSIDQVSKKPQSHAYQQPVQQPSRQQQWWKGSIPWPRRGSGNVLTRERGNKEINTYADATWVDEDEDNDARLSRSPTGTEVLALEEDQHAPLQSRRSAPIALIGKSGVSAQDYYNQNGFGSSSTSTFSSLAPPLAPTLVPPPRRSRRAKRADSFSNGEDSSSAGASPLPDLTTFAEELDRVSPLIIDRKPSESKLNSTFPSPVINRNTKLISDEVRSDTSSDQHMTSMRSWEADRSGYSTVQIVNEDRQTAGLSPFRTKRDALILQEEEEDDDGFTVMDTSFRGNDDGRDCQSALSMGALPPINLETNSRKRPLPAPPILAEPCTNLNSVTRSSSTGNTFAGRSLFGGQASVVSMQKHTNRFIDGNVTMSKRRPLPPTPIIKEETRHNRSISMPLEQVYKHELGITSTPSFLQQPIQAKGATRESWTSADGPWQADVVALSRQAGAVPITWDIVKQSSHKLGTHSLVQNLDEKKGTDFDDAEDTSEPVPFAETAVQASLAALAVLERSEQGNDWQSRWAREKLMGTARKQTRSAFINSQNMTTPSIEQNESEFSDYSNSRSRRRAVPYTRSKEELSSSADDRGIRKSNGNTLRVNQPFVSANTSQIEGQSSITADCTLDSDQQATYPRRDGSTGKKAMANDKRSIPSFSQADTIGLTEDWDEKVVPALAKRLQLEAEEEAKMKASNHPSLKSIVVKTSDAVVGGQYKSTKKRESKNTKQSFNKDINSIYNHRLKDEDYHHSDDAKSFPRSKLNKDENLNDRKKQQSTTSSLSRIPKTRRGYGCEDIKAWQASLGVASIPITLVE